MPGLEPNGVPEELANTVHSFEYNDFDALQKIVSEKHIGVVVMEVMRNYAPENNFLDKVRKLCDDHGIVLIFDECTSGFRETFGGLHLKFNVNPDLAMFGKALGNGYAVTAVVGKREVMEYAQSSFISSTFWTERIGSVAALATLEIMEKEKSWEIITSIGQLVKQRWTDLAEVAKVDIVHSGIPALASFSFTEYPLEKKTFFIQEMLARGYIASNSLYASLAHTDDILKSYFLECGEVFEQISKFSTREEITAHLKGGICHDGFKRLN